MSKQTIKVGLPACRLDELSGGACFQFFLELRTGVIWKAFLFEREGKVHGYLNVCRHAALSLDFGDYGKFFDEQDEALQCAVHGARYRLEDGMCISGPCVGKSLFPLETVAQDGWVQLGGNTHLESVNEFNI